jgi:Tol biopolymer transport system component
MRTRLTLIAIVLGLTVMGGALPAAATDQPDNGRIAFGKYDPVLDDYSLWTANPDGTHRKRLTHMPTYFSDWSPDGRKIVFEYAGATGIHIGMVDANGRNLRQLTFADGLQAAPKWSPDGRWIVFEASPLPPGEPGFSTSIWIMRADGTGARQLTHNGFNVEGVFSPDGRRIAFARITNDEEGIEALYVMDRDGSHVRRLVAPTRGLEHPDWSPDGRWITFNIAQAPNAGVLAIRPDGKGLRTIRRSDNRFELFKPVWSPDGRKLLVGCFDVQAQNDRLCIMDANGRNLHVILATPEPLNYPAWGTHPPKR